MGVIRMGPPSNLVLYCAEKYNIKHFVETGTFKGGTTSWASEHFDSVDTIENSKSIYDETSERLSHLKNVNFHFGDTRDLLKKIINKQGKALFWLDAHWCDGLTYGIEDQCPILDELDIINQKAEEHFILIDDARLFFSPPPSPNISSYWPTIDEICMHINKQERKYITVVDDVIVALPYENKPEFEDYLQRENTKKWQCNDLLKREGKVKKSLRSLYDIWLA